MTGRSADGLQDPSEAAFLAALVASQRQAVEATAACAEAIGRAARAGGERLRAGGRLVYIGAGSSGLIALQDGAELPGAFGLDADRIAYVIPRAAHLDADAEDDISGAAREIEALGPMERDVAIAGVDKDAANASLVRAQGDVKCAVVIACGAATRHDALALLADAEGHIGAALARLRGNAASA